MFKLNYNNAKDEALKVLGNFFFLNPPINPIHIAKHYNIDVHFADFHNDEVSGMYDCDKNIIYVNENDSDNRKIFTIAHELGHYFMHRDWTKTKDYQAFSRKFSKDKKELEANAFAEHLLVPKKMLDRFYKFATLEELCDIFKVSAGVIQRRLDTEYCENHI